MKAHAVRRPGKNLKTKATVAMALLESGVTVRKTATEAGISKSSVERLSKARTQNSYASPLRADHIEAVKKSIRDRFLVTSSDALTAITPKKLADANALSLAKISSICLENAGLGPAPVLDLHQNFFFTQVNDTAPVKPTPPVDITPPTSEPA